MARATRSPEEFRPKAQELASFVWGLSYFKWNEPTTKRARELLAALVRMQYNPNERRRDGADQ